MSLPWSLWYYFEVVIVKDKSRLETREKVDFHYFPSKTCLISSSTPVKSCSLEIWYARRVYNNIHLVIPFDLIVITIEYMGYIIIYTGIHMYIYVTELLCTQIDMHLGIYYWIEIILWMESIKQYVDLPLMVATEIERLRE